MKRRLQRGIPWQPSPVQCTSTYVYARVLSIHMAIYVSALYMMCSNSTYTSCSAMGAMSAFCTYGYICVRFVYVVIYSCILYGNNGTQWKERYNVKAWWQPLSVRCTNTCPYMGAFCTYTYICVCFVYLCGARVHMSMVCLCTGAFNTYGYICLCFVYDV